MTGAIFCDTRPAIIIRSAWRGEPRNTSAPKRAMSKRDADMDIISMAQQARPKLMGQSDDLRAQFTAWSSLVKIRLSKPVASFAFTDRAYMAISLSHVFTTHSIERHGGREGVAGHQDGGTAGAAFLGFNCRKARASLTRKGSQLPPWSRRELLTSRQKSPAWLPRFARDTGGRHP